MESSADRLFTKATEMVGKREYDKAILLYQRAQEKAEKDVHLKACCTREILICLFFLCKFQEGIQLCKTAENTFLETYGKESAWHAQFKHIQAKFLVQVDRFSEALAVIRESCRIFKNVKGMERDYAHAVFLESNILFHRKNWPECIASCKEVAKFMDKNDQHVYRTNLTTLAMALRYTKNYAESYKIQKEAVFLLTTSRENDQATVARSFANMAMLFIKLKMARDAVPLLVDSISLLGTGDHHCPDVVRYLDALAVARRAIVDIEFKYRVASDHRICGGCEKVGERGKEIHACSQCWSASYCSVECQTISWPEHQKICRPCVENSCVLCGKEGNVSNCGKCKKVAYCSKTCQVADWNSHKTNCPKWALEE